MPEIVERYYTVQFLDGWGETVCNINECVFPKRPHGSFAVCFEGQLRPDPFRAQRIEVPVEYMRVLSRVQLGANSDDAVALQKRFKLRTVGKPTFGSTRRCIESLRLEYGRDGSLTFRFYRLKGAVERTYLPLPLVRLSA